MIRIVKPAGAPAKLADGAALVARYERALRDRPGVAGTEKERFDFAATIYGHHSVKNALKAAQRDKCCYCEGYFAGHASGDVEHFRPKAYSQQVERGERFYPGYYWLAYTWTNLYYACELCNRLRKRNLFPLRDPSRRARGPADRLEDEHPMLLDPGGTVDPREHIRFKDNVPEGITDVGRRSIAVLGLNRTELSRARLPFFKRLVELFRVASLPNRVVADEELRKIREDARAELAKLVQSDSEYSAMAQDNLTALDG